MNNKVKTSRKNFLKWSGLAFFCGMLFAGKRFSSSKVPEQSDETDHFQSPAVSRIRPARNTIIRESV